MLSLKLQMFEAERFALVNMVLVDHKIMVWGGGGGFIFHTVDVARGRGEESITVCNILLILASS